MALALPASVEGLAPQFLALIVDEHTRERVRQATAQLGWAGAVEAGGVDAAIQTLRDAPAPAMLLVDISDTDDVLSALDGLAEVCDAHTRVVALGTQNDIGLYRTLLRMGVSDYLTKPVSAEALLGALREKGLEEAPSLPTPGRSRSVAVLGVRGGVGATSLAVSLGWGLAHEHELRTVLLDLDLQLGTVALGLDVEPGRGLAEILSRPDRVDALLVGSAAAHESERLRVLAAEEPLDTELDFDGRSLDTLLETLRDTTDAVIIDLPRRLGSLGRAALATADLAIIVTDLSLAGLRDTRRLLAHAKSLRPQGDILIAASRVGSVAGEVPRAEFERALGAPLDLVAPADAKAAVAAAEQGRPLLAVAGEDAPLAKEIRGLLARVAGVEPPRQDNWSWLKRIVRR